MNTKKFFKNLSILISTGLIIKALSMANRVLVTRFLGLEILVKYALFTPTMLLFLSLADFSLPTSLQKFIAKESIKPDANIKGILKNAFTIMINVCLILSIILLITANFITKYLLFEPLLFKPLIFVIPLMFFVSFSGILKGLLQGLEYVNVTGFNNLMEAILKIIINFIIIFYFKTNIYQTILYIVIGLNIEEFLSCLFLIYKVKRLKIIPKYEKREPVSPLFKMTSIITLNRLIYTLSNFLEPIIYTYALMQIKIPQAIIQEEYALITSYAIGLLLTSSFISHAISMALLPILSKHNQNKEDLHKILSKALFICFIPSIIISLIFFFHGGDYLKLIYDINRGGNYVKILAFPFMLAYFEGLFYIVLHSINKTKTTFFINLCVTLTKISLLFITTKNPYIGVYGLCISSIVGNILSFALSYLSVRKEIHYQIKLKSFILTIILIFVIGLYFNFLKNFSIHFIMQDFLASILYLAIILIYYKKYYAYDIHAE